MNRRIRTSMILAIFSLLTFVGWNTEAHAFWFGWFRGNRPVYPTATTGYSPQPVVAAQPIANACNACTPAFQPTTVRYAPQTLYRSHWVRVPVTAYRPVQVANQPVYAPTPQLQPCTTYRWQLQRSASYRPVYSWFRPWNAAPVLSFFGTAQAANCGTCAPAVTTVPGSQYYQQSPLNPIPATAPAAATQGNAADLRPSLKPSEAQPSATIRRATPTNQSDGAMLRGGTSPTLGGARPSSNVTPIPDLQSRPATNPSVLDRNVPARRNPGNQTASLRDSHRWAVTPINWSQPVPTTSTQTNQPRPAAEPAKPAVRWDDSGWRSAK